MERSFRTLLRKSFLAKAAFITKRNKKGEKATPFFEKETRRSDNFFDGAHLTGTGVDRARISSHTPLDTETTASTGRDHIGKNRNR